MLHQHFAQIPIPNQGVIHQMPLLFPTIAEQVARQFVESTRTTSIVTLARKRGAIIEKSFAQGTTYTFEDDTSIRVTGTGRNHRVETLLP